MAGLAEAAEAAAVTGVPVEDPEDPEVADTVLVPNGYASAGQGFEEQK